MALKWYTLIIDAGGRTVTSQTSPAVALSRLPTTTPEVSDSPMPRVKIFRGDEYPEWATFSDHDVCHSFTLEAIHSLSPLIFPAFRCNFPFLREFVSSQNFPRFPASPFSATEA